MPFFGTAAKNLLAQEGLGRGLGDVNQSLSGYRTSFDKIKAQNAQQFATIMIKSMEEGKPLPAEDIMELAESLNMSAEDVAKIFGLVKMFQGYAKERGQEGMQQDILKRATGTDRQDIERTIAGLPVEKRVSKKEQAQTKKIRQEIKFGPGRQQLEENKFKLAKTKAMQENLVKARRLAFDKSQADKPKQKDTQANYKLGLMKRAAKGEELNYTEKKLIGLHLNSYIIEATKMADKDISLVGLTTDQQIAHIMKTAEKLKLAHEGKGGKIKPLDPVGFRDVIK